MRKQMPYNNFDFSYLDDLANYYDPEQDFAYLNTFEKDLEDMDFRYLEDILKMLPGD